MPNTDKTTPSAETASTESAASGPASKDNSNLPVPVEDVREYIQVTPTETPLRSESTPKHFKRLHRIGTANPPKGLLSQLRSLTSTTTESPTIECLLFTDGTPEASLSYWFGVDDPDATSTLERILRAVFPDNYEFEHRTVHPGHLEAMLTGQTSDTQYTDWNSLRAIEYVSNPDRRQDWQTGLTSFETFQTDADDRIPLASIVETMAAHPGPLMYQALFQPKPDWSARAEERRLDIEAHSDTFGGELANTIFGAPDSDPLRRIGLPWYSCDRSAVCEVIPVRTHSASYLGRSSFRCRELL